MGKQLRSDALKLKKTPFFILHLAVPVLGVLVFIIYLGITGYEPENLTVNYFMVLALVYPIVAAWLCSIVADQEVDTGGGFFILSAISRSRMLLSKLILLLIFGLLACLLATVGFGGLAPLVSGGYAPSFQLILVSALIVWGCSIFLYLFHLWLNLKFGRNVNYAAAAFELLLAALMLTGLGDTVWYLVPSAWGIRLVKLCATDIAGGNIYSFLSVPYIITIIVISSLVMFTLLFYWLRRWEGRKSYDY